jgi:hypothetical protein
MATVGTALGGRDRLVAFAAGGVALATYLGTLPPSYSDWDTAELQTVAAIFGIAHPPGCPAFTLLGYLFVHAFPFGDLAWRLNLMCSLAIAASTSLLYFVARRFGLEPATSAVCSLGFAFALVTWRVATRAEVQDVALLFRALAFWFALRWYDRGFQRDLFCASLATGLACATHGIALLFLPSFALLVDARSKWYRPRSLALVAAGLGLGFLPYAYLPLRSAWIDAHHLDPNVALGLPAGLPIWNYGDPSNWRSFVHFVTGADFHVGGGFAGFVHVTQYPYFAERLGAQMAGAYGVASLLAIGGAVVLVATRRAPGIALVLGALLPVPYTESYSDLQQPERYYLFAFWCAAIAIGVGFERLAALFELRTRSLGWYSLGFALTVALATCAPDRAQIFNQRSDRFGPNFAAEVRSFTPDDAIVISDWGYATSLAYSAYVAHTFGHRSIVVGGASQYLSYLQRWLGHRPIYVVGFDSDLRIPGWNVVQVKASTYYAYLLTK